MYHYRHMRHVKVGDIVHYRSNYLPEDANVQLGRIPESGLVQVIDITKDACTNVIHFMTPSGQKDWMGESAWELVDSADPETAVVGDIVMVVANEGSTAQIGSIHTVEHTHVQANLISAGSTTGDTKDFVVLRTALKKKPEIASFYVTGDVLKHDATGKTIVITGVQIDAYLYQNSEDPMAPYSCAPKSIIEEEYTKIFGASNLCSEITLPQHRELGRGIRDMESFANGSEPKFYASCKITSIDSIVEDEAELRRLEIEQQQLRNEMIRRQMESEQDKCESMPKLYGDPVQMPKMKFINKDDTVSNQSIEIKVNGESLDLCKEPKVKKVKSDFKARKEFTIVMYNASGKHINTVYAKSRKKADKIANEYLQDVLSGSTVTILAEVSAIRRKPVPTEDC